MAGCIISTFPIGFVALTEYGFIKLALVILMVFGVHVVEAYGLNPAIYSAHLRLHPLLVLTVLVIAEHSMGVWGLLLAVPMTVFALDYCIRCTRHTLCLNISSALCYTNVSFLGQSAFIFCLAGGDMLHMVEHSPRGNPLVNKEPCRHEHHMSGPPFGIQSLWLIKFVNSSVTLHRALQ